MQVAKKEKLNVLAIFASFRQDGVNRRITPRVFMRENGEKHKVKEIRRSYTERIGDATHVHFVIRTEEDRYFDIVYNSKMMAWQLVIELEEGNTLMRENDEGGQD